MPPTRARRAYLSSAGTTYHGAHGVDVAVRASSQAARYSYQSLRSARSPGENFQHLAGSSRRSRNRFLCSSRETCRNSYTIRVSLRCRWRSKALMSS